MTPLPKPTIQQAVAALSDRDEFKAIIQFIQDERERFVGSVATLDELMSLLKDKS